MRVDLDPALTSLVTELSVLSPELSHLDASRILFVAGAARREARASIRPLRETSNSEWTKPKIEIFGVEMLYEVCLRPRFFRSTAPIARIETIIHELLHISRELDGTLDEDWRHQTKPRSDFDSVVRQIRTRWLDRPDRASHPLLGEKGEAEVSAWLSRPPSRIPVDMKNERRVYTQADLYRQVVELTPSRASS